jgi:hypothetical protein
VGNTVVRVDGKRARNLRWSFRLQIRIKHGALLVKVAMATFLTWLILLLAIGL